MKFIKVIVLFFTLILVAIGGILTISWSMHRENDSSSPESLNTISSGTVTPTSENFPSISFVLGDHATIPIRICGLNCDMMTVDSQGNMYIANPRFMATFSDCTAEGSAYLQENNQIVVHLTKSVVTSRPSGTVNGPQIHFVIDYKNGELISSEVKELEGNTIQMPESEQEKWGCILASFILTARTIEGELGDSCFAF